MAISWSDKLRAAGIHLAFSAAVIAVLFAVIFLLWYPDPYFRIKGANEIIVVLVAVDLVLGPALTFIVYRRGKRGLTFDLSAIVVMQLVALVYGTVTIYEERPRFMVYALDRFNVLAAKDVDFGEIKEDRFRHKPWRGPLLVFARMPTEPEDRQRLLTETMFEGKPDLEYRPEFWQPYADSLPEMLRRLRPVEDLRAAHPDRADEIDRILASMEHGSRDLVFAPVIGKNGDFAVIVDPANGAVLDAIEIDPWL